MASSSGSASKRQRIAELLTSIDSDEQELQQQLREASERADRLQQEKDALDEEKFELETHKDVLQADKDVLQEEIDELQAEYNELQEEINVLQEANDRAQEALLSNLPRYSRYCTTRREALNPQSAVYKYLHKRFMESVVKHRRRRTEPHREPPKLEVQRIERCHNPRLQEKYLAELQDMAGLVERRVGRIDVRYAPAVESFQSVKLNEFLLFHGAPAAIIDRLTLQGIDPRYAGENIGKLFGHGSYFAAHSSKSDIYTTPAAASGERCVLITRVALGEAHQAKEACPSATRPPERRDGRGPLNSIVAVTQGNGGCVEYPE